VNPRSDVVVIGAGASAAVAATTLRDAGLTVTCFEQGDWPDRASFRGASAASELVGMKRWSGLPAVRGGPADYPIDASASDMVPLNFNGVGGGTVLYNAQWPRLLPSDFRVRSEDGVAVDWPLTYAELQPFYEAVDLQFGVSGLGGNPAYPAGEEPPLPPLPIGPAGMAVARAHAKRGWHWWPDTNAILSVAHDGRRPCVQRGTCGHGCDEGAKASTDLTHWPRFLAAGGTLITRAEVRRILVDHTDRATGVEWVDEHGLEHVHEADVVLVAANGIGTARLLLASADARHPDGLANESGLVGRNLMLHPMTLVEGVNPNGVPWHGHNGGLINSLQFYRSDASRGFVRGARWALTAGGLPLATALGPRAGWGEQHHRQMREHVGRRVMWVLLAEDLPDESNRVTLSGAGDGRGIAGAEITYRIGDNAKRLLAWHAAKAAESLEAAGMRDLHVTQAAANGHFMGTARMGDDPADSVCNRWGFTHQIPNLGIIDGSVFPTAGGMNPTSTICALALRTARRVLKQGPVRAPAGVSSRPAPIHSAISVEVSVVSRSLLHQAQRDELARVADALIPAADGMPAASEAGIGAGLLDAVHEVRPDLAAGLERALALTMTDEDVMQALARLKDEDPEAYRVLVTTVAGGYYLSADVRSRLDWHSEQGTELALPGYPKYVEEGLLDHLVDAK
jgi:choline dehydrogenase-like flavoprotein